MMTVPLLRGRPSRKPVRAKYCLPLFLLSCVAVNMALVLLWLNTNK